MTGHDGAEQGGQHERNLHTQATLQKYLTTSSNQGLFQYFIPFIKKNGKQSSVSQMSTVFST